EERLPADRRGHGHRNADDEDDLPATAPGGAHDDVRDEDAERDAQHHEEGGPRAATRFDAHRHDRDDGREDRTRMPREMPRELPRGAGSHSGLRDRPERRPYLPRLPLEPRPRPGG